MPRSGVVILTDPESCGLGSADLLAQAVLQVQQLNKAGLATSQAFCDHPAAAMKFIEAYTKAYPELHLQSSDLPPPEVLYSIVADGRVVQLEAPAEPRAEMRGQESQLTPLYVLSLGAPDTLIQSLQQNRLISSEIQVLDIPPIDRSMTDRLSPADAVAYETLDRSSWRDQSAAESDYSLEGFSPSELHDEARALNDPATTIQPAAGAGHASSGPSTGSYSASIGGTVTDHSGAAMPDLVTMSLAPGGRVDSPVTTAASAPPDLRTLASAGGEAESVNTLEPPPSTHTEAHQEASNGAHELADPTAIPNQGEFGVDDPGPDDDRSPSSTATDQTDAAPAVGNGPEGPMPTPGDDADPGEKASDSAQQPGDSVAISDVVEAGADDRFEHDAAAGGRQLAPEPEEARKEETEAQIAVVADDRGRTDVSSFSDPTEDVRYPPSGSFEIDDDDVPYPLPPEGLGVDPFEGLFGSSGSCEVVDVAAVLSGLPDSAGALRAGRPCVELEFIGARGAGSASVYGIVGLSPEQIPTNPPDSEARKSLDEDDHDQSTPAIHDLDI